MTLGAAELREYATRPRRTIAEVLLDFDSCRPPLCRILDLVPPLRERFFSIASSPALYPEARAYCPAPCIHPPSRVGTPRRQCLPFQCIFYSRCLISDRIGASPPLSPPPVLPSSFCLHVSSTSRENDARPPTPLKEAHICYAVVKYLTLMKEPRRGVCTSYLASLAHGAHVAVWLRKGCLRPPPLQAPLLMVGPGTGVAPFRAFVQSRQAALCAATGTPAALSASVKAPAAGAPAPAHLFFGCQRARVDFLYEAEWAEHLKRGSLQRLHCAFSRDGPDKVYVQHLMTEPQTAAIIWRLLATPDAHVYIAGAANQMPKDVCSALREVAILHGGLDEEGASRMLKTLEAEGRLQRETW